MRLPRKNWQKEQKKQPTGLERCSFVVVFSPDSSTVHNRHVSNELRNLGWCKSCCRWRAVPGISYGDDISTMFLVKAVWHTDCMFMYGNVCPGTHMWAVSMATVSGKLLALKKRPIHLDPKKSQDTLLLFITQPVGKYAWLLNATSK